MTDINAGVQFSYAPEPQRFIKGQNNKYFGISKVGEYYIRLLGAPFKFYFHYKPDGRKICPKTLSIRTPKGRDAQGNEIPAGFVYTKTDPTSGLQVPYSAEDQYCPLCDQGDTPRKRYVTNIVDLKEMTLLQKQGLPPNVRIMEFPKQVWDYLVEYANGFRIQPSDPRNGSNFKIEAKYPDKLNPQPRDIIYKVTWDEPGKAPLSDAVINILSEPGRLYNMQKEYHPLLQKKQSVFPQQEQVTSVPSSGQAQAPAQTDNQGFFVADDDNNNVPMTATSSAPQQSVQQAQAQQPQQQFVQQAPVMEQAPMQQQSVQQASAPQTQQAPPSDSFAAFTEVSTPAASTNVEVVTTPTPSPAVSNDGGSDLDSLLAELETQQ